MPVRIVYLNVQIDATHGGNQELGFYDGTTATTLDLYPGTDGGSPDFFNSSHPHYFTQLGETIIFQATTAARAASCGSPMARPAARICSRTSTRGRLRPMRFSTSEILAVRHRSILSSRW